MKILIIALFMYSTNVMALEGYKGIKFNSELSDKSLKKLGLDGNRTAGINTTNKGDYVYAWIGDQGVKVLGIKRETTLFTDSKNRFKFISFDMGKYTQENYQNLLSKLSSKYKKDKDPGKFLATFENRQIVISIVTHRNKRTLNLLYASKGIVKKTKKVDDSL